MTPSSCVTQQCYPFLEPGSRSPLWLERTQARGQVIQDLLQTRFPISKEVVDHLLQQEGRWEGELVHTSRDGSTVIVESRQVLLRDAEGQPSAILEINRDMTAQRHLEQLERSARAEAERRLSLLQLILDEIPSSVYLVRGPEARLVLANRADRHQLWRQMGSRPTAA